MSTTTAKKPKKAISKERVASRGEVIQAVYRWHLLYRNDWVSASDLETIMYPTVYVAGPYSSAPTKNVKRALKIAERLINEKFMPYVPHLTHYWHKHFPHPYKFWLDLDKTFLARCDCVYRFPGISPGADEEIELSKRLGIPVYHDIDNVVEDRSRLLKGRLET